MKEKTRQVKLMCDVIYRIEGIEPTGGDDNETSGGETSGGDDIIGVHELPPYKPMIPSAIDNAFASSKIINLPKEMSAM